MNWDDMILEKQGRKTGPMVWVCDCRTPYTERGERQFKGKMFLTKVYADGICTRCYHYARRMEERTLNLLKQRAINLKYKTK